MKYQGILLDQARVFNAGDTFEWDVLIMDENGDYLSDLTGWTFESTMYSLGSSIPNSAITITTSGRKVTISIPSSSTEDLSSDIKYLLVLKGTLGGRSYTLLREEFWFREEIL